MTETLGNKICSHIVRVFGTNSQILRRERAARVLEEAIELAQSEGIMINVVLRTTARVYERPRGEHDVEFRQLCLCLRAYSAVVTPNDLPLDEAAAIEYATFLTIEHQKLRDSLEKKRVLGMTGDALYA